jgi:signal transduction histidine kinase
MGPRVLIAERRPVSRRTLVSLAVIGGLGVVFAGFAFAAWAGAHTLKPSLAAEVVRLLAGGSFLVVALVPLAQPNQRRVGALMWAVGATWFIYDLGFIYQSLPYTFSRLAAGLWQPLLVHLGVSFPSGHLKTRLDRAIVAAAYGLYVGLSLAANAFWDPRDFNCAICPANLLLVHRDAGLADAIQTAGQVAVVAVGAAALIVVIFHWRNASFAGRRALDPIVWASPPLVALVVAYDVLGATYFPWLAPLAMVSLPAAFLTGLIRMRLARAEVGRLIVDLKAAPAPDRLREALVRTLGDPTLQVLFRLRDSGAYVDEEGRPVAAPKAGGGRAIKLLDYAGEPIAMLVHDVALLDDPELIEATSAAASMAIENARLQAEVRAQLREVRASRARIVAAADSERRRLERDLHDGAQQRLASMLLALRKAQAYLGAVSEQPEIASALREAAEQAGLALADLRELARGIHPAILSEAGLGPALEVLAQRMKVPTIVETVPADRFPASVESAVYFVVSEALANVVKHSRASTVLVSVVESDDGIVARVRDDGVGGANAKRGTGLQGLADRVGALDGRLKVLSFPGGGTTIVASIPARPLGTSADGGQLGSGSASQSPRETSKAGSG